MSVQELMAVSLGETIHSKRSVALCFCFAALLALSIVAGEDALSASVFLTWFILAVMCFIASVLILSGILALNCVQEGGSFFALSATKLWLMCFAIITVLWLPYFLQYYPGCTSTDSSDILKMVLGMPFESDHFRYGSLNSHHPFLYTAFVAVFVNLGASLGGATTGIALVAAVQMLVFSGMCSAASVWLGRMTSSKVIFVVTLAFFALNPVVARYSVTLWKDVFFAGVLLLFLLAIADAVTDRGSSLNRPRHVVRLVVLGVLVCLLRSNGMIAVFAGIIALAIACRVHRGRVVVGGGVLLTAVILSQNIVFGALGVVPGHFAESVSIPLQQISRTIVDDGAISSEQLSFVDEILPVDRIEELYNPISPNPLKFAPDFNDDFLEQNKMQFLTLWLSLAPNNFDSYASAWRDETLGYWHIGTDDWIVAQAGYSLEGEEWIQSESKLPSWLEVGSLFFRGYDLKPGVRGALYPLFSIGCLAWFMLFAFVVCASRRNYLLSVTLLPLIALWVTFLLAAPTACEFRYMFALHLALPFVAVLVFHPFGIESRASS